MLHLAMKAFYPSLPPFPLLHVDTTWKFQEMYAFRDTSSPSSGWTSSSTRILNACASASTPSTTVRPCTPTCGRPRASSRRSTSTGSTLLSAAPGATRRSPGPRSGSSPSARPSTAGIRSSQRPELWRIYNARTHPGETVRVFPLSNWTELDVWQYIHLEEIPIVPLYLRGPASGGRARRDAHHGRRRPDAPGRRRGAAAAQRALPHPRLLPVDRCDREHGRQLTGIIQEMLLDHHLGTPRTGHRPRLERLDGEEEAGRLLLMAHTEPPHRRRHRRLPAPRTAQVAPALHHLRLGRRRQVHADRALPLRVETGLRGSPGRARSRLKKVGTQGGELDFALLVDGLAAEREQGITIDVAYRFFSTETPQVRRGRHAWSRAVHAQHGHRRVDGRTGRDPGRCPQGNPDPDPAPQLPRVPPRDPPRRPRRQQARPGRLLPGGASIRSMPTTAPSRRSSGSRTSCPSRSPRCGATTLPRPAPIRPGTPDRRLSQYLEAIEVDDDTDTQPFRFVAQWVNRPDLDFRGYLRRHRRRDCSARRPHPRGALGRREHRQPDRHLRRRSRRGCGRGVGHPLSGRRDRRQPGRRDCGGDGAAVRGRPVRDPRRLDDRRRDAARVVAIWSRSVPPPSAPPSTNRSTR